MNNGTNRIAVKILLICLVAGLGATGSVAGILYGKISEIEKQIERRPNRIEVSKMILTEAPFVPHAETVKNLLPELINRNTSAITSLEKTNTKLSIAIEVLSTKLEGAKQ